MRAHSVNVPSLAHRRPLVTRHKLHQRLRPHRPQYCIMSIVCGTNSHPVLHLSRLVECSPCTQVQHHHASAVALAAVKRLPIVRRIQLRHFIKSRELSQHGLVVNALRCSHEVSLLRLNMRVPQLAQIGLHNHVHIQEYHSLHSWKQHMHVETCKVHCAAQARFRCNYRLVDQRLVKLDRMKHVSVAKAEVAPACQGIVKRCELDRRLPEHVELEMSATAEVRRDGPANNLGMS